MAPPLNQGPTMSRVLALLAEHGPMTAHEAMEELGITLYQWSSVMRCLKAPTKRCGKRVYVAKWVRDVPGARRILMPAYALGDRPDAKKPAAITNLEAVRRYQAKRVAQAKSVSVWLSGVRTFSELQRLQTR